MQKISILQLILETYRAVDANYTNISNISLEASLTFRKK